MPKTQVNEGGHMPEGAIRCPKCGEPVPDGLIDAAIGYAHDVGFDEGYESAMEEVEARSEDERLHAEG